MYTFPFVPENIVDVPAIVLNSTIALLDALSILGIPLYI